MKKLLLGFLTLTIVYSTSAQIQLTKNVLKLDSTIERAAADINDMAWYADRWVGEGFGGIVEENFSPSMGGTMIGTFRLVSDDNPSFYEMLLIEPDGNSLVYKVKHFNPDYTGWEEKEDYVSFPLVNIVDNRYYFQGLTIEDKGDEMIHYLAMKQKDGSYQEMVLKYRKAGTTDLSNISEAFKEPEKKTQLLLLGSYHMSNPGADQFNLESDDVLQPKRQEEILEVVKKLAAFKPTKICIEAQYGDSAIVAKYKTFLKKEIELRKSEKEQIGFRLAKLMGHETIYPIDVKMNIDQPGLQDVITANPAKHGPRMGQMESLGGEAMRVMGKWLAEGTVSEVLYNMNQPAFNDLNYQMYLKIFLPTVEGDNYAGADLAATWYHRNLRIMSNLHKIDVTPEDKVLIIFGQGHIPLFERIAKDSPYFEVVDVLPYLK